MNTNQINYLNILLMIVSCVVAFFIPFELFLFSYGVLGPLHYLTEIGWLHKKSYFTKGKYDFTFLILLCAVLFYYSYVQSRNTQIIMANIITLSLFLALIFVFVKDWLYRGALIVLSVLAISVLKDFGDYFMWIGIFLPTIIHVFIFTWVFMLYGVLKEKSFSGFLSVGVLILCASTFFLIQPQGLNYQVSDYIQSSYRMFNLLNYYLIDFFHMDTLTKVSDIFVSNAGFVVMRFVAFAYTYHYLNWFSKTSVIKWHQVPRPTLILTLLGWAFSVALYIYDYNVGLKALFFLSFLHVFLEFPLNVVSFTGVTRELSALRKTAK